MIDMVVSADTAAKHYREGIEEFGGAASYIECGKKKDAGFLAVAKCLADKKAEKLTTDAMVKRYKEAA